MTYSYNIVDLQSAVYSRLASDSELNALVTGVYDKVPQNSNYPFISLGDWSAEHWSTQGLDGLRLMLSMEAWSKNGGKSEIINIQARIYSLLGNAQLTLNSGLYAWIRFAASDIKLLDDGLTYHGHMKFRLWTHA